MEVSPFLITIVSCFYYFQMLAMEKRNKSIHFPKTYEDFVKSNFLCSDRQLEITVLYITKYLGSTMKVVNFSNRLTLKKLKVVLLLQIGNFLKLLWFVRGCQTAIQKLKISKFLDPFPKLKWNPMLSSLSLYVWHSFIKSVSINKLGSLYNFSFLWVCIVTFAQQNVSFYIDNYVPTSLISS